MNKYDKYRELVNRRKQCTLCTGVRNPSEIGEGEFDSSQIGPWSLWQSNLDAKIMVIGQDWGDVSYFKKWKGVDQPTGNPTNTNLQKLLKNIGCKLLTPCEDQSNIIFLTNMILCMKTGGLQGKVEKQWFENCACNFLIPLIKLINPRIVISLGKKVSETILDLYEIPYKKNAPFSKMVVSSPYQLTKSTVFFPQYHCGAGSINRNRSMSNQEKDWDKINIWQQNNLELVISRIIEKYKSSSHFNISKRYEGAGSGLPFPRLNRAAIDQICEDRDAVFSRYAIWANTVRDYIVKASEKLDRDPQEATNLLKVAVNNLSAFSEIQSEIDSLEKTKCQD